MAQTLSSKLTGLGTAPAVASAIGAIIDTDTSGNVVIKNDAGTTLQTLASTGNTVTTNTLYTTALTGPCLDYGTLAALGTNQATAAAIAHQFTVVTAADGTVGVKLPAGASTAVGSVFVVVNSDVTSALKLYAAGAETIGLQAGTTAISIAAKVSLTCILSTATTWQAIKGVTPY